MGISPNTAILENKRQYNLLKITLGPTCGCTGGNDSIQCFYISICMLPSKYFMNGLNALFPKVNKPSCSMKFSNTSSCIVLE